MRSRDKPTLYCTICGEVQFETFSGTVCENGHGGVEGTEEPPEPTDAQLMTVMLEGGDDALANYAKADAELVRRMWQDAPIFVPSGHQADDISVRVDIKTLSVTVSFTTYSGIISQSVFRGGKQNQGSVEEALRAALAELEALKL